MVLVVKNIPASAEDTGSIPGSGRSPGKGNGDPLHSHILAWRIPCTEEFGGLKSTELQRMGHQFAMEPICPQTSER